VDEKLSENKQNNVDKHDSVLESKSEMSNFSQEVIQSQGDKIENTGLWYQKPRHDCSDVISPSLIAKKVQKTGSSPLPVSSRKSVSMNYLYLVVDDTSVNMLTCSGQIMPIRFWNDERRPSSLVVSSSRCSFRISSSFFIFFAHDIAFIRTRLMKNRHGKVQGTVGRRFFQINCQVRLGPL
jgi:hypothetical protein